MKNLLIICALLLITAPTIRAQELSLATASLYELKTVDFSKLPPTSIYYKHRDRTPGTIGMIVGGSVFVIGGTIMAATLDQGSGIGYGTAYMGLAIGMTGVFIAGVSGLVYVVCRIAHVTWGGMYALYSTNNQLGIARNL